jgi:hypothetical protein
MNRSWGHQLRKEHGVSSQPGYGSTAQAWAHLVVCGEEVFVREQRAIAAYHWRQTTPKPEQ